MASIAVCCFVLQLSGSESFGGTAETMPNSANFLAQLKWYKMDEIERGGN